MRRDFAFHLAALLGISVGLVLAASGCASREPDAPRVPRTAEGYEARQASALVYPLGTLHPQEAEELEVALSRAGRGESALVGYDLPTVTYYTLRVDDYQQTLDWGWGGWGGGSVQLDDYSRRATSVRSFVRHR